MLLCGPPIPAIAETQPLHLVANFWEPFTGGPSDAEGAATELVRMALLRAGYPVEIDVEPWARAINQIHNGHYDGVVAVWRSEERAGFLAFSNAYFTNDIILVARKDKPLKVSGIDDLAGLTVGVGRGYDYSDDFIAAKNFTTDSTLSAEQNLKKLSAGRVDVVVEDRCIARFTMRRKIESFDFERDLEILPPELYRLPLYFAMRLDHPQRDAILDGFNRALEEMRKDGSYGRLLARYGVSDC